MGFFEFPHTRTYDNDLGWLIRRVISMNEDLRNFININTIKYADPIAWNITTQYEANTVVINPADGTAYISTNPVPSGVSIRNTDYWTPIFNYGESMNILREQIAAANQEDVGTALAAYNQGQLVWWEGILYRVLYNIAAGTQLIVDTNVEQVTIEDVLNELDEKIDDEIANRQTAIDELDGKIDDEIADRQTAIYNVERVKVWKFDTVSDMATSTSLVSGDYCRTGGYHSVNDGGGAIYRIGTGIANGLDIISCAGGLVATMLDTDGDIRKYGYNTGAIDDYINRALAAVNKAYIRAGVHTLESNITIPGGAHVYGDGMRSTILHSSGSVSYGFVLSGSTSTINDIGFIHNPSDTPTDGVTINIQSHSNIVRNIFSYNAYTAFRISNFSSNFISDFIAEEFSFAGVEIVECTDNSIKSGIIKSNKASTYGVRFINFVEAIKVIDVSILLVEVPVYCASSDSGDHTKAAKYNYFTNCFFDSCTNPRLTNAQNFKFVECWFSNRPETGLSLVGSNTRNIVFIGCTFQNSAKDGLYIETSKDIIIIGCDFSNNGDRGLMITNSCSYVTIVGNQFYNSDLPSGSLLQQWGLFINGDDHSHFIITNNIAHDNTSGGYTSGMTPGNDYIVDNNIWS